MYLLDLDESGSRDSEYHMVEICPPMSSLIGR